MSQCKILEDGRFSVFLGICPQLLGLNQKKVRRRKAANAAAIELGTGNGRVEAINNKIKVTVRMGYGFRNTDNLIELLMLRCSDNRPTLPGRAEESTKKKAA
ncbi:transposase [Atopobium sp. oral taxon 416]|uniref:transposase n=1 Tax=Atopobium sp. oral taxon 416 TaxID=712157 RepID=UPI001BAA801D|nr:transposase [Atopobium sp. oral taxon 416]QUC04078.1 transposase [Atopobium sp. oral taxon 416]